MREGAMPSIMMPAEAAYNPLDTSCSNSSGPNADISSSATPIQTSDASSAAPAANHIIDPPAGVRVRPVRRIENTISRQVTFCKRRTRLFKNACELAVLGDAQVAVILFAPTGRMHHYASSSMSDILERYRDWHISHGLPPSSRPADVSLQDEAQFWRHEAFRLREHLKYLTDLQSCLLGENLSFLPFPDMEMMETTLEAALYKTRLRKMELLQLQDQTTQMGHFLCGSAHC